MADPDYSQLGPRASTGTRRPRGRLKIFLGYASGVGKTLRMLDEARRRAERGEDVVVASHQPGAQAEIRTLLDRLEIIPTLRTSLGEGLHMEAILHRKPQVCVIDPLAHNNPAGFPNRARWQDIEQVLNHGISVLTSVNLLHIDDLRERVEALTGKHTRETVPREFLARADEIVVVDVPPDFALGRGGSAGSAAQGSAGRERVLSELREMALLLAAEVVEGQLERYLQEHGIPLTWGAHERILVCLTPRSDGEAMIASGLRNRDRFHGELHVVHVKQSRTSSPDRSRLQKFMNRAREAGAETKMLEGDDPIGAVLEYARLKKITQIYIGHSKRGGWLSRFWTGPLDRLLRGAENMDVRIFPQ